MNSYLTQAIAREQVNALIAQAEARRVRRLFRQARREERAARRGTTHQGPSNHALLSPNRIRTA
jgi:hypothetical protein